MKKNKIKCLSSPPMIILLDVLFVFLFILIIKETPPETKIIPPDKKLSINGFLKHSTSEGKTFWYNPLYETWSTSTEGIGRFVDLQKCNKVCIDILKKNYDLGEYQKNIEIVITNELYDNISRITYMACQSNKDSCGNIVFNITDNWKIDREKLFHKNPFLLNVKGLKEYF